MLRKASSAWYHPHVELKETITTMKTHDLIALESRTVVTRGCREWEQRKAKPALRKVCCVLSQYSTIDSKTCHEPLTFRQIFSCQPKEMINNLDVIFNLN